MTRPIGSILWPLEKIESVSLVRKFMVEAVCELKIEFDSSFNDPVEIVKQLVSGEPIDDLRRIALAQWWNKIDEDGIRNFSDKKNLIARLAVCLLQPSEQEDQDLGEHLSWFLEVLGFLETNVSLAIKIMQYHFFLGRKGGHT